MLTGLESLAQLIDAIEHSDFASPVLFGIACQAPFVKAFAVWFHTASVAHNLSDSKDLGPAVQPIRAAEGRFEMGCRQVCEGCCDGPVSVVAFSTTLQHEIA